MGAARRSFPLSLLLGAAFCGAVAADDLSHVADEELSQEIEARESDIARTSSRIRDLGIEEEETEASLSRARELVASTEARLSRRAAFLYRLTRSGATLRYLLASESATSFLKRVRVLEHLVVDGLESRRLAGVALAEASSHISTVREDLVRAREMLDMLEEALEELRAERGRREAEAVPAW